PCKMLGPILENVSKNIEVLKVDVDKFENLARNYSVMSIPTLILFKKGQIVDKKIGFIPEVMLNEWIDNNK
ncbi:MAG TPA: thiol reductase thioredoxin, partial [Candidatus Faecisoma merdavium]|nr:thiol reductase thioredoxin [Candidatus Faecisoma merdavium]